MRNAKELRSASIERSAGVVLNYASLAVNVLATLVYVPALLGLLGDSQYGLYQTIGSVIAYLSILDGGLGTTLTRYYAFCKRKGDSEDRIAGIIGMVFVVYFILTAVAVLVALIVLFFLDDIFGATFTAAELETAEIMMLVVIADIIVVIPGNLYVSLINAEERFIFARTVSIIKGILQPVAVILVVIWQTSAISVVLVQFAMNLLVVLINRHYCKTNLGMRVKFGLWDRPLIIEMLSFSFFVFLGLIFDQVFWRTDQIILGVVAGTSAVALYSIASTVVNAYISFSNSISSVFLPKLSQIYADSNSNDEANRLFTQVGRIQTVIVGFIVCVFVIFGKQFIAAWTGVRYLDAYYIVLLFMVGMYLPLIQNLGVAILQAKRMQSFKSVVYVVIAVANVLISIPMTIKFGYYGCSVTSMVCLLVGTGPIINWYYKARVGLDLRMFFAGVRRPFLVSAFLCMLGLVVFCNLPIECGWGQLVVCGSMYSLFFIGVELFLGLNAAERQKISRLLLRRQSV